MSYHSIHCSSSYISTGSNFHPVMAHTHCRRFDVCMPLTSFRRYDKSVMSLLTTSCIIHAVSHATCLEQMFINTLYAETITQRATIIALYRIYTSWSVISRVPHITSHPSLSFYSLVQCVKFNIPQKKQSVTHLPPTNHARNYYIFST